MQKRPGDAKKKLFLLKIMQKISKVERYTPLFVTIFKIGH